MGQATSRTVESSQSFNLAILETCLWAFTLRPLPSAPCFSAPPPRACPGREGREKRLGHTDYPGIKRDQGAGGLKQNSVVTTGHHRKRHAGSAKASEKGQMRQVSLAGDRKKSFTEAIPGCSLPGNNFPLGPTWQGPSASATLTWPSGG